MYTEVYNWVQKYDTDLDNRQVSDENKLGHMANMCLLLKVIVRFIRAPSVVTAVVVKAYIENHI